MNKEEIDKALELAKLFSNDYKKFRDEILETKNEIRIMRGKLKQIDELLSRKTKIDVS